MKILKNYKTTLPALCVVIAVGVYWLGYLTTEQLVTGVSVLTGLGLLGSKDYDKA